MRIHQYQMIQNILKFKKIVQNCSNGGKKNEKAKNIRYWIFRKVPIHMGDILYGTRGDH